MSGGFNKIVLLGSSRVERLLVPVETLLPFYSVAIKQECDCGGARAVVSALGSLGNDFVALRHRHRLRMVRSGQHAPNDDGVLDSGVAGD